MIQLPRIINYFKMNKSTITNRVKLGRWNMDDNTKTELKIYYANEDHCGVCQDKATESNTEDNEDYYKVFII